jgi:succinate dehydrogenase / fumarate reductase iron-sulfur subunit
MNVIACLQYIAAHPITIDGHATTPVVYDSNCLEEVCGACTMLINGKARQACSALVDKLEPTYNRQIGDCDNSVYNPVDYGAHPPLREHNGYAAEEPITLEPLTKFPVVRDLFVDRRDAARHSTRSDTDPGPTRHGLHGLCHGPIWNFGRGGARVPS